VAGLFVTGTDTGVGKTVLSAAVAGAIRAAGVPVSTYKPVLTGLDEPAGAWPSDDLVLAAATAGDPAEIAPLRYGPAVSPHLAGELERRPIDAAAVEREALRRLAAAGEAGRVLVVEGVGGLLVPLAGGYLVRDLAAALGLPLLIAARPGLGTISHTLLTLEAARAAGLEPAAVVLTPWPTRPGAMERSNRETIERLGDVDVATLPPLPGPDPAGLAEAGGELPWRSWLERPGSRPAQT